MFLQMALLVCILAQLSAKSETEVFIFLGLLPYCHPFLHSSPSAISNKGTIPVSVPNKAKTTARDGIG